MSIFHLSVKSISRSMGRSAVAAAAYRAGEKLTNHRDGLTHDFTGKPVIEALILAPRDAPAWALDRSILWNQVEATERRKDAKVAREYEIALPAEISPAERRSLTLSFADHLVTRYGVAVDVAIHPPNTEGDQRNHHAHLLTTTRALSSDGFSTKTRQLDVSSTASVEVEHLRKTWADMVNRALERAHIPQTVDHRSFSRQGIEAEPTIKLGPISTAIERRASRDRRNAPSSSPVTDRGRSNQLILQMRRLSRFIDQARDHLRREMKALKQASKTAYRTPNQIVSRALGLASKVTAQDRSQSSNLKRNTRQRDRGGR
ncbi:MobQ family relaxase [uncultured Brevundimonas sp.]|uniref:MobQ family relaxase n=1 Tax=uncultured Brevundimonas sp. TaxID=213418 RepID=UPI00262CA819|nr:MobQ family relaxase [uncultured Brevundimonas sp.]